MTNDSHAMQQDNDDIKHLEELVVGSGSADFRKLEQMVDVFCPFEATGMVRQEIKHSNFLSYILNPNRPHVFGVHFLEEFLALVTEQSDGQSLNFSRMDLHFMDLANAITKREWNYIDILIELPSTNAHKKGIVVAVELKIDAGESEKQLAKYKKAIEGKYHRDKWDHAFVFLTKDEIEAGEGNEEWIPLGLDRVITSFESIQKSQDFIGASSELFSAYANMMRRHILENKELEDLARKLWSKHPEALNILYNHKPNLRTDIVDLLFSDLQSVADKIAPVGYSLSDTTSTRSNIRFIVNDWQNIPEMQSGDKSWLTDCNHLMAIELHSHGEDFFKIIFVMGPGIPKDRERLFNALMQTNLKPTKQSTLLKPHHHHFFPVRLLEKEKGYDYDAIAETEKLLLEAKKYLEKTLPVMDKAIQKEFCKPKHHIQVTSTPIRA